MVNIAIVEDDPLIARLYQKAFIFERYEAQIAGNGREGLELIRQKKPTLVLLDIMMPEMNGLEVLDKLKSDPETKNIPVVILTNLAGEHDAETALAKGAVKYIIKSEYDPQQIVDMVKEIIGGYTRNDVPSIAAPS